MNKSLAIIHHFAPENVHHVFNKDGNLKEWGGPGQEPTDEEYILWDAERLKDLDLIAWIGNRKAEYLKEGCTEEALIVALWEKIIEGRPETADALQVKRQAVKEKIKKPNLE